jgi:hypothetical protein
MPHGPVAAQKLSKRSPAFPLLGIFICIAGFLAPVLTVKCRLSVFDFRGNPSPSTERLDIWLGIIGVQATTWAIIVAWAAGQIRDVTQSLRDRRAYLFPLLYTALLFLPLIGLTVRAHLAKVPPEVIAGIPILRYFGPLGTLLGTMVVFVLFLAYEAAVAELARDESATLKIVRFSECLATVQQFFVAASLILGLGVVGTAAQQNAIEADHPGQIPPEYVVLFGLLGSLVLLAAYAPIRMNLYRWGKLLVEEVVGPIPQTPGDLKSWIEQRSCLEVLVGQELNSIFGLGGALPLLLPVVIGSLTKLMPRH